MKRSIILPILFFPSLFVLLCFMRFLMMELFTKSNIFYMEKLKNFKRLHGENESKYFIAYVTNSSDQVSLDVTNKSALLLAIGNPTSPIHSAAIATWCDITDNSELVLEHHNNIKLFSTLWPRLLQLLVPKRWCSQW
jgi:hypothetical protein